MGNVEIKMESSTNLNQWVGHLNHLSVPCGTENEKPVG
jgi:hypothetical protein